MDELIEEKEGIEYVELMVKGKDIAPIGIEIKEEMREGEDFTNYRETIRPLFSSIVITY